VTVQPGEHLHGLVAFRKVANIGGAVLEIPWSLDGTRIEWSRHALGDPAATGLDGKGGEGPRREA
jgi:hypothetical protein